MFYFKLICLFVGSAIALYNSSCFLHEIISSWGWELAYYEKIEDWKVFIWPVVLFVSPLLFVLPSYDLTGWLAWAFRGGLVLAVISLVGGVYFLWSFLR